MISPTTRLAPSRRYPNSSHRLTSWSCHQPLRPGHSATLWNLRRRSRGCNLRLAASAGPPHGWRAAGLMASLDIRHIPYKGVIAALPDLLAERLAMMFSPAPIVLPTVGRAPAPLATTSLTRM